MADVARAVRRARVERRAVVLMLPLDVQAGECDCTPPAGAAARARAARRRAPSTPLAALLRAARAARDHRRPRRGAGRRRRPRCGGSASCTGAVLATSAVANGLFAGDPYALGIAGGFSSPTAARLLREADVVIALRRRAEPVDDAPRHADRAGTRVIQVDLDEEAIGAHRPVDVGIVGDAPATAEALLAALGRTRRSRAPHARARGRDRGRRLAARRRTRSRTDARSTRAR